LLTPLPRQPTLLYFGSARLDAYASASSADALRHLRLAHGGLGASPASRPFRRVFVAGGSRLFRLLRVQGKAFTEIERFRITRHGRPFSRGSFPSSAPLHRPFSASATLPLRTTPGKSGVVVPVRRENGFIHRRACWATAPRSQCPVCNRRPDRGARHVRQD